MPTVPSTSTFHEVRFPEDISVGAVGGPQFKTTILTLGSGEEKRNIEWRNTRGEWNIGTGLRYRADFAVFQKFFYARMGRAYGFRFKDWSDYQIQVQQFTVNAGVIVMTASNTKFQIYKEYASGGYSFIRSILKPRIDPNLGTTTIKVNGATIPFGVAGPGQHWSIDWNTGILTFVNSLSNGDIVEITYMEFDVAVRFDIDKLEMNMAAYEAGEWVNIPIVELKNGK